MSQRASNEYSSVELAHFLNRPEILLSFPVILKGTKEKKELPVTEWESLWGVAYTPNLLFADSPHFLHVIRLCPYIFRWFGDPSPPFTKGAFFVSIRWIDDELGYGLFAEETISKGAIIGEYTGVVRPLSRQNPDPNGYCVHYPTRWWSRDYHVIDALQCGNETRFINHSDTSNLEVVCGVDRHLLHFFFRSKEQVSINEQLTCDYGVDYWQYRTKKNLSL